MHHLRAHPRQIQPASHPPCRSPIASIPLSPCRITGLVGSTAHDPHWFSKGSDPFEEGGRGASGGRRSRARQRRRNPSISSKRVGPAPAPAQVTLTDAWENATPTSEPA